MAIEQGQMVSRDASTVNNAAGRYRWRICALLFAGTTLNYMDRQVLGVLAPELQRVIGWSELEYSTIVTLFQAAYGIGLLCAGADALDRARPGCGPPSPCRVR